MIVIEFHLPSEGARIGLKNCLAQLDKDLFNLLRRRVENLF